MKILLVGVFIGLFLIGHNLVAQDCQINIRGRVLDRATKEPLGFASIGIIELAKGVIADSAGYFDLGGICPGGYHIRIDHLGCASVKKYIFLQRDTSFNVLLEHHDELLREVIVEGRPLTHNESHTQQTISTSMIKEHAGQTISDITGNVIGVNALSNGSGISKPIIHGLFGNRVAIINNGLLQAGQQWGADHAPEIDPNSAGIITVVKGSDAIEYGSHAIGGAVVIEGGPINVDPHFHGTFGYAFDFNGLGHTLYGKSTKSYNKFDLRWTATIKKSGDRRTPEYFLTNTGAIETNTSLQLNYHANQRIQHQLYYSIFNTVLGVFAGSHISNLTDLEEAIGRDVPFNINDGFSYLINAPKQHVTHHLLKYNGKNFIKDEVSVEWLYGVQSNHRQEFDIRRGSRSQVPALDLQLWAHSLEARYVNQKRELKYKVGLQGKWTDNTNDFDTGILPLIPDYREWNVASYFNSQLQLGKILLEAGARYDLQLLNVWAISTTLPKVIIKRDHLYHDGAIAAGMMYKHSEISETRLNNMIVRRSPEVNELYSNGLHQGIAGIEEGDWNLTPETSFKSILTQSILLFDLLHIEMSPYSHLIYDYIYLKPEDELRLTIRGAFPVYTYRQKDVWIRGFDFTVIADLSKTLEWSGKMSLIKANTISEKESLSLIPPSYFASAISWAIRDSWNWKGTKFKIEGEYTSRQTFWDREGELLPPPDGYFLLSAKFESGIQWGSDLVHFGIYADNLLNIKYRNYLNRLRYFSNEQGRSLRFNIRYEF